MEESVGYSDLQEVMLRGLERVWKAQGREGTLEEFMQKRMNISEEEKIREYVEIENRKPGNLHEADGFDCKKCLNRGEIWHAGFNGKHWQEVTSPCSCMKTRASIKRMERSGLKDSLKKFSEFEATEQWQTNMLNVAQAYAQADFSNGESLFIGGAVGGGKTHVCSAVCRELLYRGHEVIYMPWLNESKRLKAIANKENGAEEVAVYSKAEILYIDDLFKPTPEQPSPTGPDVRLAYEIINYRYINKLPMIISCEFYMDELLEFDEATISRLYERSKEYAINVARMPGRNYRMKGAGFRV